MSEYFEVYAYEFELGDRIFIASSSNNPGITDFTIEKEINKAGSVSFTILPTHPHWQSFHKMVTRVDVYIRGKNVFHGRVTEYSVDFYKTKNVRCEGNLAWLIDNYKPVPEETPQEVVVTPDGEEIGSETSESLDYTTAFPSTDNVDWILEDGFNSGNRIEEYKHFHVGIVEFASPFTELVDPTNQKRSGKISTSDGTTIINDPEWTYLNDYIDIEDGTREFQIYAGPYVQPANPLLLPSVNVYFYDGSTNYLGYREAGGMAVIVPDMYYPGTRYFKISANCPITDVISLTNSFSVGGSAFDGGTYADFITQWIVDNGHMMLRARYDETRGNLLDVLNPERYNVRDSIATLEFSKNLVNFEAESQDIEPYSIIAPIFNGKAYLSYSDFTYVIIPSAISRYGRIVKAVDFGEKPDLTDPTQVVAYKKMIGKLKKLYDDQMPEKYTVSALDDGIIFDNDALSVIDIGDPVTLISRPHDISKKLLCISMKLDLLNPSNNSYTIGNYVDDTENYKIKTLTENYAESTKRWKNNSSG